MNEKQQEELKERTKFKAQLRNTEKKEILETEIYLEYNESLENIHIVIHDLAGTTDKFYSDFTEIECSGEETEDEIMQYLVDFWESRDFPFEFFFMPEIPGIVKLGEREYLVYELKTEQKLSYKEIAHILKIEESTVRHHYRNAKAKVEKEEEIEEELTSKLAERLISLYDETFKNETWNRLRSDKDDEEEINQMFGNVNSLEFQKESELKFWANEATDEQLKEIILKAKRICDEEERDK